MGILFETMDEKQKNLAKGPLAIGNRIYSNEKLPFVENYEVNLHRRHL